MQKKALMLLVGAHDSISVSRRAEVFRRRGWVAADTMEDLALKNAIAPENVQGRIVVGEGSRIGNCFADMAATVLNNGAKRLVVRLENTSEGFGFQSAQDKAHLFHQALRERGVNPNHPRLEVYPKHLYPKG